MCLSALHLLLNLVSASNSHDKETLWGFIQRYAPESSAQQNPKLDEMVGYAIAYYEGLCATGQNLPGCNRPGACGVRGAECRACGSWRPEPLLKTFRRWSTKLVRPMEFEQLRDWFKALYEVLLGQSQGPRFGGFVALYGVEETRALISDGLAGKLG